MIMSLRRSRKRYRLFIIIGIAIAAVAIIRTSVLLFFFQWKRFHFHYYPSNSINLQLANYYLLLAYCQQKRQQWRKRKKEKGHLSTIDFATSVSFDSMAGLETIVSGQSRARLAWVFHLSQSVIDSPSSRFCSSAGTTSSRVRKNSWRLLKTEMSRQCINGCRKKAT